MDSPALICPKCSTIAVPGSTFCAHCGTMLIDPTQEKLSFGKQLWIYLVSVLAPPLGIVWFFKYLRSPSTQKTTVGVIALLLTVLSSIVTIWMSIGFFNALSQQVSSYSNLGL